MDPNNLDELYRESRQATDQWQRQVIESGGAGESGETVKLEATIPSKEPLPDIPGQRLTEAELAAMGLSYDQIDPKTGQKRQEFTVESPEVQAIRQQAAEHAKKLGTGKLAAEEVGKVGRQLAEALHPGVSVAGRALGLDEEGADALATGFVEFLAGLPGKDETEAMAGIETALAALPGVGMAIKGGKMAGKVAKEFARVTGDSGQRLFHGGKQLIENIEQSKLQQRDKGLYGEGFYLTAKREHAKNYGPQVSEFTLSPDAKVLDVGTIHPQFEHKIKPELQAKIVENERAYLEQVTKKSGKQDKVQLYLDLIDPDGKSFDLGSWITAVNRYAKDKGFDVVKFSDGEVIVKNPAAVKRTSRLSEERGSFQPGQPTKGGAKSTSAISPPPGTQAPSTSDSTRPLPSGSSTTRSTAPSALTGPAITLTDMGVSPSGKKIIQPSNDVKDLFGRASAAQPTLESDLAQIVAQTPGLAVVGTRVKDAARFGEKLAKNRTPDTISDYLGARIAVETPEAMDAAITALAGRYPIVEFDDFRKTPKAGGYRAVHMQAQLPNGLSAEIQLVPKQISALQEQAHVEFYEKWRNQQTATPEQFAAYKQDIERWNQIFADAYDQWIEGGKTATKIAHAGQKFEERLVTFSERLSTQRRGVRSDVQVAADSISPEALQQEAFLDLPPGTILRDSDVVAVKRMFKDLAEPVRLMAQAVAANPQDEEALLALLRQLPEVDNALTRLAGTYAESGRTQRLLSPALPTGGMIPAESQERIRISDAYIQQWLAFFQEQEQLANIGAPALTPEKLVGLLAELQSPEQLIAAAKVLAKPSKWDMFVEYWINGLLSGPQTHATNILSNAATLAWAIPERALAAMFSSTVRPSESLAMIGGILEAQGDAFRLAWQAFKKEESQLGHGKLEGPTRAITGDALELTGIPGRAIDFLGSILRLPGRMLLASDDYFKSIAFRAELRALAKRTAFAEVTDAGLTGKAASKKMAEIEERLLTNPPDSIDEAAREFASYMTFTRELGETGQKVQQALSTPIGRIFVPFVRTPTNIFKFAGERTPLAFASQAVRDEIAAGGPRRALALAKISLGAMTMGYLGMLASEGIITGGGPKDKRVRQQMIDAGWKPYAIKVGDTHYQYSRIEPLASLIGLAADAADLLGQLPEKDADELAAALTVALSRQVAQKTFVKGLSGSLNAIASQDLNVVKAFFEKELPTLLPFSSAMGATARELDPVMREVNSVLDAFKAKVPGYSDTLPPRRNLFGEPIVLGGGLGPDMITPIYTNTAKHDPVTEELVRLQLPLSMPSKSIEGVPLDPLEYDAYVVLQGSKPIIGDKTLHEQLADTMQSELYKQASGGPDGGKAVLVQQWINAYREQARAILDSPEQSRRYLGTDYPDLQRERAKKKVEAMSQFNAPVEAR